MEDSAKMMVYDAKKKSKGVAYVLWLFLGGIGAHRFYTARIGTGIAYLVMQIGGWLTMATGLGAFLFLAVGIWWVIDAFLIPGMIRQNNLMLAAELTDGAQSLRYR